MKKYIVAYYGNNNESGDTLYSIRPMGSLRQAEKLLRDSKPHPLSSGKYFWKLVIYEVSHFPRKQGFNPENYLATSKRRVIQTKEI